MGDEARGIAEEEEGRQGVLAPGSGADGAERRRAEMAVRGRRPQGRPGDGAAGQAATYRARRG